MSRPKQYQSPAERQAAYRARHPDKQPIRDADLAILARSLHCVLGEAVEAGTCPLPDGIVGARVDQTLRNLIRYLDPDPDQIRYGADA